MASAVFRVFRDALLAPPGRRFWRRCLLNGLLASSIGFALASAALGVVALAGVPLDSLQGPDIEASFGDSFGAVVLAPVLETLLLAGMLAVLPSRWSIVSRAAVAGVAWGVLHGLQAPLWFFAPTFAFFVYACGYLAWRPVSFTRGFAAAAVPHALNNLVAILLLAIEG